MSDLKRTAEFVRSEMAAFDGSHDWQHIRRVCNLAQYIGKEEKADLQIVQLAALLHDVGDHKFQNNSDQDPAVRIGCLLDSLTISPSEKEHILRIIEHVSFGKENKEDFYSLELACVQDADRLDAIGAIGIARTFHYGGYKGFPIYDPDIPPRPDQSKEAYRKSKAPTINHFYEKLLLLKDKMQTDTGRSMAQDRHNFLLLYLEHFKNEWTTAT